ncbi:MAG: Fic family protein [Ilumatobacteraceae bacterium]
MIFFDEVASAPTLRAAARDGQIAKLARGVWTGDTTSAPDVVVAANIWAIVARFLPDAIVVDRAAAAAGRIDGSVVTVSTNERATPLELPGVTVLVRPRESHDSDTPWSHGLTASASARTIVDNLAASRARERAARTLTTTELLDWLARKSLTLDPASLDRLHVDALAVASDFGRPEYAATIDRLFDEVEGRRPLGRSASSFARAVRDGTAWDAVRVAGFARARDLIADFGVRELPAPARDGELPFFEAYFSNSIEGTEFTIDDARVIVATQVPPARRAAEGHDILGTHRCVVDPVGRAATSVDPDELDQLMRARHQTVMVGRPDIGPGVYKQTNNRVAGVEFVDADLVAGTLRKGFEMMADLPPGFARCVFVMFVVAEVHPFTDGNGRVARLMMNAELSSEGLCRIVVPTVLRNEYVSGLRRASRDHGDISVLCEVLDYARRWTAAMPWVDAAATDGQLAATHATMDSTDAQQRGAHLTIP